jgi:hypothetical protein
MRAQPARNSARLLAPIALGLFVILFFVVVLGSGSDEGPGKGQRAAAKSKKASKRTAAKPARKQTPPTYTVNPYGLQSGQKIKLRE